MRVDKKKSGLHAKRRGPILGKVLCTLALFGCLAALLYNSAQNVQLSRDKNAALLLDNLTLQRQNRETGDALEQSQNRTQSLEAQVAKLQQQLSELQRRFRGWKLCAFSADVGFEKAYGRRATRRRRYYNGRIECEYRIFE